MSTNKVIEQEKSQIDTLENVPKDINVQNTNKILFSRRINNEEKNKRKINLEFDKYFNDPESYFSNSTPIQIGNKVTIKSMDLAGNKDSNKKMPSKFCNSPKGNLSNSFIKITKQESNNNKPTGFGKKNFNSYYDIIDNKTLEFIYQNFKLERSRNKQSNNPDISLSRSVSNRREKSLPIKLAKNTQGSKKLIFPYDLLNSLNHQNKQISLMKSNIKSTKNLSKYLSKKLRKNENDLLINNLDLYRYKKEILSGINKERNKEEKFGKFQWKMNLRKSPNFIGENKLYINLTTESNPLFGLLIDKCPYTREYAIKSGYNLNQKEFIKFENNKNIKDSQNLTNVKKLDDLNITGKNLLKLEYNREMSSQGRKKLYRVFIENGKAIFDKDINQIFGEETIYKNYENKYNYQ